MCCSKGSFIMCGDQYMGIFEVSKGLVLCLKEVDPFVVCVIIYKYEVVKMTLNQVCIHKASQVHVDEVKKASFAVS